MNETDFHFAKCIGFLYASTQLRRGDPIPLQYIFEESLKSRYGISKDYTEIVRRCFKEREIYPYVDESMDSSSDNELELDLLKEDLMCVICNGMDVGVRNRLVECSDCHSLYHQECHQPLITEESFENWICINCKEASKKVKITSSNNLYASVSGASSKSSLKSSSSHRHSHSKSISRSIEKCNKI